MQQIQLPLYKLLYKMGTKLLSVSSGQRSHICVSSHIEAAFLFALVVFNISVLNGHCDLPNGDQ